MDNPFAISTRLRAKVTYVEQSKIVVIDNIFANPEAAVADILSHPADWNKPTMRGMNGIKFEDRRHRYKAQLNDLLTVGSRLSGQQPSFPDEVITNYTLLYDDPFNDYENNYWWPHVDLGYNAIVYLNHYDGPGTNLFNPVLPRHPREKEHIQPWNPREHWELVTTIQAKYNRLVLFDGQKFYHSMAIEDRTWFEQRRLNIVQFFKQVDQ